MAPSTTADVSSKPSAAARDLMLNPARLRSNGISTYDLTATNTVTSVRCEAML